MAQCYKRNNITSTHRRRMCPVAPAMHDDCPINRRQGTQPQCKSSRPPTNNVPYYLATGSQGAMYVSIYPFCDITVIRSKFNGRNTQIFMHNTRHSSAPERPHPPRVNHCRGGRPQRHLARAHTTTSRSRCARPSFIKLIVVRGGRGALTIVSS
jgi:hypothetical protein